MTLLDSNILIHNQNSQSAFHQHCKDWLDEELESGRVIAVCWLVLFAYLRITTNRRISKHPVPSSLALKTCREFIRLDNVRVLDPGPRHLEIVTHLADDLRASGDDLMDIHLAALAIEHGVALCTTDRGFRRFPRLRLIEPGNPLPH